MKKNAPVARRKKSQESGLANSPATRANNGFYIAGIGASAGGLEALKVFFDHAPSTMGIAFVVVQHLDPTHESLLTELLRLHTSMPVMEAVDDTLVQRDTIYVMPPNTELQIKQGRLHVAAIAPREPRVQRKPIDTFFHSLAEDQGQKAIGIVVSGTGTDGAAGLEEINTKGGMTMVQDPETAQFAGMPQQAIATAAVDHVLPVTEMPAILAAFVANGRDAAHSETASPLVDPQALSTIFQMIRQQIGYDFSGYKQNTLVRRIAKRMALHQLVSMEAYLRYLENHAQEVVDLSKHFLIGVTSFFRDPQVFKILESKTIPYLISRCLHKQDLRTWVCGCSTGEEAYSIAMAFSEALQKTKQYIKVTIFATDIDREAIDFARGAVYSANAVAELSPERIAAHFTKVEKGYHVKQQIREMVIFAHHNLIKDPPFSKMDMISCRNLLIYINAELQQKIIPLFHYSLQPDGILLLGTSESIGDLGHLFGAFDEKTKFFLRKETERLQTSPLYQMHFSGRQPDAAAAQMNSKILKRANMTGITEKILLDEYAPPSVIIDQDNIATYFSGNTGLYLDPPSGVARFHIFDMAKKGLKTSLEQAVKKARKKNVEIVVSGIDVLVHDYFKTINLKVKPLVSREYDPGTLMLIFEPATEPEASAGQAQGGPGGKPKLKTSELEKELKVTREHLQIVIKELEIANEDLQSTNEEFQSSNEELQSTNEELETSREELQSVNEELISVNSELTSKIEQVSDSNNDLNNLLRSMEVATVYLDLQLKIKRFTPAAAKIFNLIPTDIDRPVTQLSTNLVYQNLVEDVQQAMQTLVVKSFEVKALDGTWYAMRIIPYRTMENAIEGVLVTLVDITTQKNTAFELEKANSHLRLVIMNLPAVAFSCTLEPNFRFDFLGENCLFFTGFPPERWLEDPNFWASRIHPADRKKTLAAFSSLTTTGLHTQVFRWKCENERYKHFFQSIRYSEQGSEPQKYIVGMWQEASGSQPLSPKS